MFLYIYIYIYLTDIFVKSIWEYLGVIWEYVCGKLGVILGQCGGILGNLGSDPWYTGYSRSTALGRLLLVLYVPCWRRAGIIISWGRSLFLCS